MKDLLNKEKANFTSFQLACGEISRTPLFSDDPIRFFLGKNVVVKVDDNFAVSGKLIHYMISEREKPHRPSVLVLENNQGRHIIRGKFINITRFP